MLALALKLMLQDQDTSSIPVPLVLHFALCTLHFAGYTPLRLAEYSNRGHLLSVQGYSEDGQMSVTSLNFTGTLEERECP